MEKKLLATIVLVTVASLSIAGCLSSLSSNQASPSAAGAVSPSVSASPSATPSATPSNAPSPTVTPPADVYQVVISGPTVLQLGEGGVWTATVYKNGIARME